MTHDYEGFTAKESGIRYFKRPVSSPAGDLSGDIEISGAEARKILGQATGYKLVVAIPYERNQHQVKYQYTNDTPGSTPNPTVVGLIGLGDYYYYGQTVSVAAPATADGYTFSGWTTQLAGSAASFTMPDRDVIVSGTWTAQPVSYHIDSYYMGTDGIYPATYERYSGETKLPGETASVEPEDPEGFTFDSTNPNNVLSVTVTGDGEAALKIYYKRNKYPLSYVYTGYVPTNTSPAETALAAMETSGSRMARETSSLPR